MSTVVYCGTCPCRYSDLEGFDRCSMDAGITALTCTSDECPAIEIRYRDEHGVEVVFRPTAVDC